MQTVEGWSFVDASALLLYVLVRREARRVRRTERRREVDVVRRFGCRYGQGYFFGRPIPAPEMEERLRSAGALVGD